MELINSSKIQQKRSSKTFVEEIHQTKLLKQLAEKVFLLRIIEKNHKKAF